MTIERVCHSLKIMSDRLTVNQRLRPNESLLSHNGRFQFILQSDGNLVLYRRGGSSLWSTNTSGRRVQFAVLQADGNFVLYGSNRTLWSTRTSGSGVWLVVQDDGNVVIYDRSNRAVWATGAVVS